jgi:4-amino-4-deoxy-L-arabinose transferase-like glycosyltransferase
MISSFCSRFSASKAIFWVLLVVVLVGAFLRLFHFSDYLHFQVDQARDALVINRALDGSILDLPLLGPKAGGTFLRLGPAFYYLQYGSAVLFGDGIASQVFFVALFGIALIPLFFLLARRGFSEPRALAGTALLSVSLFTVMYSRFGWNPNLLPFFAALGFWALLKAVDEDTLPNRKRHYTWLAAFGLGMATQMHFLAFVTFPVILVLFLVWRRPRLSLSAWLGGVLIIGVLYMPMLLNETKTQFANTREFFGAVTEKSNKEAHPFLEKLIRNTTEYGLAEVTVLTGYEGATSPQIETKGLVISSLVCDAKCDHGKWAGLLGLLGFLLVFISFGVNFFLASLRREKDLYALLFIWQAIAFILFIPLAYGIAPRFYLVTLPLFFLGPLSVLVMLERLRPGNWWKQLFWLAVGCLVISNLWFVMQRFDELARAKTENVVSAPDRVLKERYRVTYEQQQQIVTEMLALPHATEYPLYFEGASQYKRAFKYLLSERGVVTDGIPETTAYHKGVYAVVFHTRPRPEEAVSVFLQAYDVASFQEFGTLTLAVLTPKSTTPLTDPQAAVSPAGSPRNSVSNPLVPRRFTWREYFNGSNGEAEEVDATDQSPSEGE